jgi:hypothetical protein
MKSTLIPLIGALAMAFAAGAQAETTSVATLSQVTGKVMVNKGKGFVAAKSGMALADADRLITLDGSGAVVVYGDGCASQMKANSVMSVSKALGCKSEALSVQGANIASNLRYAAVGATPGIEDSDGDGVPNALDKCPDTPLGKVVNNEGCIPGAGGTINGGVVVGGIIVGSIIAGNSSSDNTGVSGQ